jgi:hypothetical protein
MLLEAKIDSLNQAKVEGYIQLVNSIIPQPITFLIDTGCSQTCLLPDDVMRLGIEHNNLPIVTKTIITANGPVNLKLLTNVEVSIPVIGGLFENKRKIIKFPISELAFLPPNQFHKPLPTTMIFSLLGMDVLKFFPRWTWKKDKLVMDFGKNELDSLIQSLKI